MGDQISQRELRNDSGEVLRRVERGESLVITRNGTPVAELRPLRRQRFVAAEAAVALFAAAPAIDSIRFRADLDAVADQDPTPRA